MLTENPSLINATGLNLIDTLRENYATGFTPSTIVSTTFTAIQHVAACIDTEPELSVYAVSFTAVCHLALSRDIHWLNGMVTLKAIERVENCELIFQCGSAMSPLDRKVINFS
jgi:hypothetical protein